MNSSTLEQAKVIFVDYFNTLVLRKVTAAEVLKQWAKCLKKKYPSIPQELEEQLPKLRLNVFKKLRKEILERKDEVTEVTYEDAIGALYDDRLAQYQIEDREKFISLAKEIDFSIECGCEYANKSLISQLQDQKKKGKKVYIVSDFYLGAEYLKQTMKAANVPDGLVDDVFVSCDCGRRKAVGDLYAYVLEKLQLRAEEVVMIGDNKRSDFDNAQSCGLMTVYQPRNNYKIRTHIAENSGRNYSKKQLGDSMNEMFRHGANYSEYIGMFYVFTKRLYTQLKHEQVPTIAFMAREGHYLKQLFELFETLSVPESQFIESTYYWCSRRSVMAGIKDVLMPDAVNGEISLRNWLKSFNLSVEDAAKYAKINEEEVDEVSDLRNNKSYRELVNNPAFCSLIDQMIEDNNKAFKTYTEKYIHDDKFRFVDSGWKCTTQNTIEQYYGIKTAGYYIGVQIPDQPIGELERTGLVFSEYKPKSKYYDYLGMNIPFYQQLLAAPHGTALKYILHGENMEILHEWDPMEKKLYDENIKDLQEYMLLKFRGLCVWDEADAFDRKNDWSIAKQSMKSSLFADGTRLQFVRNCTENYVQNFRQENRGKVKYDYKKVRIGIDIIWKPEKYLRYFAKIQRTGLYCHKAVQMLYMPFAHIYYGYTLLWHVLKNVR
jgi:FMN phosphatase YigB (HAD superfamily)